MSANTPPERRASAVVAAVLIVASVLGGAVVGAASAAESSTFDHRAAKPDHVTLTYNETALETYAPALVTRHLDQKPAAVYGWKASSPEHDTDVYVYFVFYEVQRGISQYDSHVADREPVYVYVDDDSGEVTRVQYSAYHYLKGAAPASMLRIESGTHPALRVASNWHHYLPTSTDGDPPSHVKNLGAQPGAGVFNAWLSNGWHAELDPGTATNPWVMRDRSDWWRESTVFGISPEALSAKVGLLLGEDGAGTVDAGVVDIGWF